MPINRDQLERWQDSGGPRSEESHCTRCGYNLRGSVSERCPECGQYIVASEWKEEKRRIKAQVIRVEESTAWLRTSIKIGAVVLALRMIAFAAHAVGAWTALSRLACVISGFAMVFLAVGALRAGTLPQWAREELDVPSSVSPVGIALGGGVLLATLGILI